VGEEPGAQRGDGDAGGRSVGRRRVDLPEEVERRLQPLDPLPVDRHQVHGHAHAGPGAQAGGGQAEPGPVALGPGRVGGPPVDLAGTVGVAQGGPDLGQGQQHVGGLGRRLGQVDALERQAALGLGLVVGGDGEGPVGRGVQGLDHAAVLGQVAGGDEVVGPLGQQVVGRAEVVDGVRGGQVEVTPAQGGHALQQPVADEGVGEGEAADGRGVLHHEVGLDGRVDGVEQVGHAHADRRRQQVGGERPAQHGGGGEDPAVPRVEVGQPALDHVDHGHRQAAVVLGPAEAVGHQLLDEERVALGALVEVVAHLGPAVAGEGGDEGVGGRRRPARPAAAARPGGAGGGRRGPGPTGGGGRSRPSGR
jgi:hypothetical protein